ncbi:MAG TPA: hypothetical protein VNS29_15380 [Burkholderiaceae bacterium]|nr:hypothetical protein [Burkholderiaceae bacterium]
MTKPIFVDLGGSTVRIDPQYTPESTICLTIMRHLLHNTNLDLMPAFQIRLTVDHADALAEALKDGRMLG